jgi:hypothetical protein
LEKENEFSILFWLWAKTRLETESGPASRFPLPLWRSPARPSRGERPVPAFPLSARGAAAQLGLAKTGLPQQTVVPKPTAQPTPIVVPLGPDPRRTEAKQRLCAPYKILTKSEPNWIKVGLEIEFNLPTRSPTEKTYKKVPRWPSIPSNSAATLTSLSAVVALLHRIFHPTEALSSTAGTRRCRWSAPHRELVTREAP